MGLHAYKEIVGAAAGFTTIAQFFSPLFICRDIIKQGSTNKVDPTPFIGGIGMSLLNLQYGVILNDPAMIPVNIAGLLLNLFYLTIFYIYTNDKSHLFRSLGKVIAGSAVLLGYAQVENENRVEYTYGLIITVLMLILIGSPLLNLQEIIRSQDASALPFPMILSGTVVTFLWLLYGIIIENIFVQVQNVVAFVLCVTQLVLCLRYSGKSATKKVA